MIDYLSYKDYLKTLEKEVIDVVFYVDTIELLVYNISFRRNLEEILSSNKGLYRTKYIRWEFEKRRSGGAIISYHVEIEGPTKKLLELLSNCLFLSSYTISAVEITCDLITKSVSSACRLIEYLLPLVVIKGITKIPTFNSGENCKMQTVFFGKYEDSQMAKMYLLDNGNDKHGFPAFHSELRMNGAEKIDREGVSTLMDLVQLNYPGWYKKRIRIMQVNRTKAGHALLSINKKEKITRQYALESFKKKFSNRLDLSNSVFHYDSAMRPSLYSWRTPWEQGFLR